MCDTVAHASGRCQLYQHLSDIFQVHKFYSMHPKVRVLILIFTIPSEASFQRHSTDTKANIHPAALQETREVSKTDGEMFARRQGCLFAETSAKADVAVSQAFEELVLKILETPVLLDGGPASHPKPNLGSASASNATQSCCG